MSELRRSTPSESVHRERVSLSQLEHRPSSEVARLQGDVLRDFHLSFKFSQGKGFLQRKLLQLATDHYKTTADPAHYTAFRGTICNLDSHIQRRTKLPRDHFFQTEKTIRDEFQKLWATFSHSLDTEERMPSDTQTAALRSVLLDTVYVDLGYNKSARPINDDPSKDPHASFFREYIIRQSPTGSPTYDAIFRKVREFYDTHEDTLEFSTIKDGVAALRRLWEENHPGQKFEPEADA